MSTFGPGPHPDCRNSLSDGDIAGRAKRPDLRGTRPRRRPQYGARMKPIHRAHGIAYRYDSRSTPCFSVVVISEGMKRLVGCAMGALLLPVLLAACGGASRRQPESGPRAPTAAQAEFEAIYRARQDSARMRFTPADADFITGMIGHHAQALIMSRLAPTHGASASVRTLAARIINAQNDEIALMSQWLRERRQPVPEVQIDGPALVVHGAEHAAHMPGMLTDEQMRELDRARGADFDRLFLTYMIQHHRGAVTMVHQLFATPGAGQEDMVFKLASDIQVDQLTEIARMESMLAARTGGRRP